MMDDHKTVLTWDHIRGRAHDLYKQMCTDLPLDNTLYVYGVPRGGVHAAQAVCAAYGDLQAWKHTKTTRLVTDPNVATVIVDDIIDSGDTARRYAKSHPSTPFYALINKQHDDRMAGWVTFPWETMKGESGPQDAVRRLIEFAGDDPDRDGLRDTPDRVVKAYGELFSGYRQKPEDVLKQFDVPYDEMVLLKDIDLFSTCEHHLLPFYGKAYVAYVPSGGRVVGLSKLARLVDVFARRLQVQERITEQVTDALNSFLMPLGCACVIEATHLCVCARGVGKQGARMVTSSLTGCFRELAARAELFNLIRQ